MDELELSLLLESLKRGFVIKGRTVAKLGRQCVITLPTEYNELWGYLNEKGVRITVIIKIETVGGSGSV